MERFANWTAKILVAITMLLFRSSAVWAQNVTPNFASTPLSAWTTDRYDPSSFTVNNAAHGRNDVIDLSIGPSGDFNNRASPFQFTFYNTQGRSTAVGTGPGSWMLQADLWVNRSWATDNGGNYRRTDMWGVATDAGGNPYDYPIIGFSNLGGSGYFRGYDVNTGAWDNFSNAVNYGAWNTLAISWSSTDLMYRYFINGSLAGTVQGDGVATGISSMILQAYDPNGDPSLGGLSSTPYDAEWSNSQSVVAPEPASLALMGTGLIGILGFARRRRAA